MDSHAALQTKMMEEDRGFTISYQSIRASEHQSIGQIRVLHSFTGSGPHSDPRARVADLATKIVSQLPDLVLLH